MLNWKLVYPLKSANITHKQHQNGWKRVSYMLMLSIECVQKITRLERQLSGKMCCSVQASPSKYIYYNYLAFQACDSPHSIHSIQVFDTLFSLLLCALNTTKLLPSAVTVLFRLAVFPACSETLLSIGALWKKY